MSAHEAAWTTAGAAGILSVLTAVLGVWLLLTQPVTVATAADAHDVVGVIHAAASALRDIATWIIKSL
jgi:hypothetical protein